MNITGLHMQIFDQNQLIDLLEAKYGNSKEERKIAEVIRGGMCYMLSMGWILRLLEDPLRNPATVFSTQYSDNANLMYYKQLANNYAKYIGDLNYTISGWTEYPSAEQLPNVRIDTVDKKFVESCSVNNCTVGTYRELRSADDITCMFSANCAVLVSLKVLLNAVTGEGFGHKMALWRYDGQSYFFDPNEGVFSLTDFSRIIADITNEYVPSAPSGVHWKIGMAEIVKV